MPKSSNSKTVSFAPQSYTKSDVGDKQSVKGYVYLDDDHPPVLPNEIFGDPTNPRNIINGRRTPRASKINDSQLGKTTNLINDKTKPSAQKASAKAASSAQTSAAPHVDKDNMSVKASKDPTLKKLDDRHPQLHNEEEDAVTFEEEVLPGNIRRGILALVKRSLRVADDVAAYMRGIEDHDVQGEKLDGDVDRVLTDRAKKRKADAEDEEGRRNKVAKIAL